jgi:hypothetical protein
MHDVLELTEMLSDEFVQRRESGYDVAAVEGLVHDALRAASPAELDRSYEALES